MLIDRLDMKDSIADDPGSVQKSARESIVISHGTDTMEDTGAEFWAQRT